MKLIIGLGNIGKNYENTYHNVGFMVLDKIAKNYSLKFNKQDCLSDCAELNVNGEKVILAKPRTYMNESGKAVLEFIHKYKQLKLDEDLLIVYDDLDLPAGSVRIKEKGGAGTHNGMRSVVSCLNSQNFRRIRVGINEKPQEMDIADFVLSKLKSNSLVQEGVDIASDSILSLIDGEMNYSNLMNAVNSQF
ncbi:MAG: aminoacyl-tRNA hydrolase [Clostridia bacterium]|nr:aminoacyl-tRNA hydrolase [Clostridia bacterium]